MNSQISDYGVCKVCIQPLPQYLNQGYRANDLCSDKCMNLYLLSSSNATDFSTPKKIKAKVNPAINRIKIENIIEGKDFKKKG